MHREAALQFGDQIADFGHVERARRDKEHEIRANGSVFGVDRAALDDGQDVALHALARYVRAAASAAAAGDFVDLVQKHDAALLRAAHGFLLDRVLVNQLVRFLVQKNFTRLAHLDAAHFCFLGHHAAHHIANRDGRAADLKLRGGLLYLDLYLHILQLAPSELVAQGIPADRQLFLFLGAGLRFVALFAKQKIERVLRFFRGMRQKCQQPVLRQHLRAGFDLCRVFVMHHAHGIFRQIPDDGFHVAAHIPDFRELCRLDLDKRRIHQLGQPAGDFRFAHARGADHQDIFRRDLLAHVLGQLRAAVTVAKRDGDGAFGFVLADDVAVELPHDLMGG